MNIIISGAFGHIGSYILNKLILDRDIKRVLILDNFTTQRYTSFLKLNKKKLNLIDEDLVDFNFNLIKGKYDIFLHLSAITNASESFKIKKKIIDNNLGVTKKVVKFCKKKKIRLIFPSSTSVYGRKHEIINSKNNMKNLFAQSPYADSKIKEEKYIRKYLTKYTILRLGTIVGVSEGMRFHTAVNKFCYQASLNKPLTLWKKFYKKKRPYLSIEDCFKTMNFIIKKNVFFGETLDVVSSNYTVEQIVNVIRKYTKVKKKFVNTEILNQNSYEVISDSLISKGLKLNHSITKNIEDTLKILK